MDSAVIGGLTKQKQSENGNSGAVVWHAPAPAKINLFLHITGRRADGYHELQTLFEFLDLVDELTFTPSESKKIVLDTTFADVEPQHNLVVQAAQALREATGYVGQGCRISLTKRIPSGAGLGGGSSDAATTLVVLNELWKTGLNKEELMRIATPLGADVPVFIAGSPCWAEGIGERLQPVKLPPSWYVLVYPGIHITTADVFGDPQLTRNCSTITIADFENGDAGNVCEAVAFRRFPEVARIHALIQQCALDVGQLGHSDASHLAESNWATPSSATPSSATPSSATPVPVVRMTGTGSCIFARCASHKQASNLYTKVRARLADTVKPGSSSSQQLWVTAGCNKSPLYSVHRHDENGDTEK